MVTQIDNQCYTGLDFGGGGVGNIVGISKHHYELVVPQYNH